MLVMLENGRVITSVMTCEEKLVNLQRAGSEETSGPQEGRKWPQRLAALVATLGAMSAGCALGWTSPALPMLQGKASNTSIDTVVTDEEASWIGSLLGVGALIGALPAGCLANLLGRRVFLLVLGIPFTVGWGLTLLAHRSVYQVLILYLARFILGLAVGAVTVVVPLYNGEIAEDGIRGALGAYMQLMITVGILWVYVFGAFVRYDCCLPIASGAIPLMFCLMLFWMPESPVHLLMKGRAEDAEKSLKWLRGVSKEKYKNYDTGAEISRLQRSIRDSSKPCHLEETKKPFKYIIKQFLLELSFNCPKAKAVQIVFGLMIFQQLSGINAIIFYTGNIFKDAGSTFDPAKAAIIVGTVQVMATYISSLLVDRVGRRKLLLVSDAGMAICHLMLSFYFYNQKQNVDIINIFCWLPMMSLVIYIILFSIGLGPLPWLMMAELVPSEAKGWASALAVCLNWTLVFTVTKVFPGMLTGLGTCATFVVFSGICTVGTVFIALVVPETKGKSLQQIQLELGKT